MSAIICMCMFFNISWVRNYKSAPKKTGFAHAWLILTMSTESRCEEDISLSWMIADNGVLVPRVVIVKSGPRTFDLLAGGKKRNSKFLWGVIDLRRENLLPILVAPSDRGL